MQAFIRMDENNNRFNSLFAGDGPNRLFVFFQDTEKSDDEVKQKTCRPFLACVEWKLVMDLEHVIKSISKDLERWDMPCDRPTVGVAPASTRSLPLQFDRIGQVGTHGDVCNRRSKRGLDKQVLFLPEEREGGSIYRHREVY